MASSNQPRLAAEGPWRATILWNSIVRSLHSGIPLKRHRRHMRTYDDCFTANEAIDWLHKHLKRNPNFDADVSKDQTVMLLQKLLRAGVIVKINNEDDRLSSVLKTPSAILLSERAATSSSSRDVFKAGSELYRVEPASVAILQTPGKPKASRSRAKSASDVHNHSHHQRSPFADLGNTPKEERFDRVRHGAETKLGIGANLRNSFRRIKNKHRKMMDSDMGMETNDDEDTENGGPGGQGPVSENERQKLNLSYLQSLPANSLVVLDNDSTWREVYTNLLETRLSRAHVESLDSLIDIRKIIYNMTKVSEKGVVQLEGTMRVQDLPHWTLSAMKCLANWPRPFRALTGNDGSMPDYEGFELDVFAVVKEYFLSLDEPLTTFDLFDVFVSAYIKAEAVSARPEKAKSNRDLLYNRRNLSKMGLWDQYAKTPAQAQAAPCLAPNAGQMAYASQNIYGQLPVAPQQPQQSHSNYARMMTNQERVAHVRQTLEVAPPYPSSMSQGSLFSSPGSLASYQQQQHQHHHQQLYQPVPLSANMSTTTIMRNFLPPNSCFETAFMNECPVTRIVPQREHDIVHFSRQQRPPSRASCYAVVPIPSAGSVMSTATAPSLHDSRSIATQTSDEEGDHSRPVERRRTPLWRRAKQRKSIAIMETNSSSDSQRSKSTSALQPRNPYAGGGDRPMRTTSSVDNLLDGGGREEEDFLQKYQHLRLSNNQDGPWQAPRQRRYSMASLPSSSSGFNNDRKSSPPSDMILSKTVRKEKRKQREKRERSQERLLSNMSPQSVMSNGSSPTSIYSAGTGTSSSSLSSCQTQYRTLGQYHHLTVKTPLHICGENAPILCMDEGMQKARAEPFMAGGSQMSTTTMSKEGRQSAIDSFQLLGLLIPPENRRKLQLLLKFMRRVSAKSRLQLHPDPKRSAYQVVLDTFSNVVLRADKDLANYDEELCRRIVQFFMENYEEVWTPPVCLRKEVEEQVYESLVSKRIQAGEDPYPITFCKRVPSKVYEREKTSGLEVAMLDLLDQILTDTKMSIREKKKKLKKFKASYPNIYRKRFPSEDHEPEYMRPSRSTSSMASLSSKLKGAMRI